MPEKITTENELSSHLVYWDCSSREDALRKKRKAPIKTVGENNSGAVVENRIRHPIGGPLKLHRDKFASHWIAFQFERPEEGAKTERRRPIRRLTNRDSRKCQRLDSSRSFALVTPDTFDFGENGVYQPVRVKGSRSCAPRACVSLVIIATLATQPPLVSQNISLFRVPDFGESFPFSSSRKLRVSAHLRGIVRVHNLPASELFLLRRTYRKLSAIKIYELQIGTTFAFTFVSRFPIDGTFALSLKQIIDTPLNNPKLSIIRLRFEPRGFCMKGIVLLKYLKIRYR